MNELDHNYNFNDLLEVTEIFRIIEEQQDSEGKVTKTSYEYGGKTSIVWEDIKMIKQYAYPDDWVKYKGEKYHVTLHGYPNDLLVLGSYKEIANYWNILRNTYPLFEEIQD